MITVQDSGVACWRVFVMVFNHKVIFGGTIATAPDRLRGLSNVAGSLTTCERNTVGITGTCDIRHGSACNSVTSIASSEFRGRLRI